MSMTAEKIVSEALSLSPHVRAFVAEQLIESLDASTDTEISAAWREEIRMRCREVDDETVELGAAADVFAKAYSALA
jgi:hypothetical protein